MDITFFGRTFGLMVFLDNTTKAVLYHSIVSHEINALYKLGMKHIKSQRIDITSITYDGRRGLKLLFTQLPMQMCQFHQFHQLQLISRYLTCRPKYMVSIELRQLSLKVR